MKTNNMINRAKNTTVGKVLCRLVGEEAGQTMMEYVIIAVLIAAACTAAVIHFGRAVARQNEVATNSVVGNVKVATEKHDESVTKAEKEADDAVKTAEKFGKD